MKQAELVEGRALYEQVWYKLDIPFDIYIFDVLNPEEIMQGATPQFKQRGPYVYK